MMRLRARAGRPRSEQTVVHITAAHLFVILVEKR